MIQNTRLATPEEKGYHYPLYTGWQENPNLSLKKNYMYCPTVCLARPQAYWQAASFIVIEIQNLR